MNTDMTDIKAQLRQHVYYVLIFLVSFLALVFLPMIGSTIGIEFNLPTTTAG